jgi:hypothetical protein
MVSEARMNGLNYLRAIEFFVALALIWWVIPFRRLSLERGIGGALQDAGGAGRRDARALNQ